MVSTEIGGFAVNDYLKVRENFLSLRNRVEFSDRFQQEALFYSSLSGPINSSETTWDRLYQMDFLEGGRKVTAIAGTKYCSALASELFGSGVYRWKISVHDFSSPVWLGIAREIDEGHHPLQSSSNCYHVCFGSDGKAGVGGRAPQGKTVYFETYGKSSYLPGQIIEFTLDTLKSSLKMKIDGVVAMVAWNVDTHDARAFVGFTSSGSAFILDNLSRVSVPTYTVDQEERAAGYDNSLWSSDLDRALIRIFEIDQGVNDDLSIFYILQWQLNLDFP